MKKIVLFLLSVCSVQAFAATVSVTTLGDAGAGSLRDVIAAANPGDTVDFSVAGTITLSSGHITLNKNLVILSSGPANIALSGNSTNRIFDITGGNIYIEAISFENGVVTSSSGGAIQNVSTDSLILVNCIFNSCSAAFDGGAIVTEGAYVSISNSTFTNNHADFDGGGIRINDGQVRINNSTFNGNTTGFSGAALRNVGPVTCSVINSTLSGNVASLNGGGFEGDFNLMNCTITGNTASNGGGAKPANSTLQNCIVFNNTASGAGPDLDGNITSNGNNIIGDISGSGGFATSDLLGQDPLLDVLGFNGGFTSTHALMSNSPAIDAGSCMNAPNEDQRGNVRIGYPDIGAYEFGGAPFVTHLAAESICSGDTFILGTQRLDTAGVYTEIFQSYGGCDSTVELTLTIKQIYNETANAMICMGDSLVFGTMTLFSSGTYTELFSSSLNCDSTVELSLTVIEPDVTVSLSGKSLNATSTADSYQWLDCSTNQILPNDTDQVFTALVNGDYAVIITVDGCSDTSACVNVTNVGVSENNLSSTVTIFPTQVINQTTVHFGEVQKSVSIVLMDVSGREVFHENYSETKNLILDLSTLRSGNYFIKIDNGSMKSTHRVVKID